MRVAAAPAHTPRPQHEDGGDMGRAQHGEMAVLFQYRDGDAVAPLCLGLIEQAVGHGQ